MRMYGANTVKKLYFMLASEIGGDAYGYTPLTEMITKMEGNIESTKQLTTNYKVEDLFDIYDKYVPKEKRLFHFEVDGGCHFIGIFTIDELVQKLNNMGYFEDGFWRIYRNREDIISSLEDYKLGDGENIAYERLWGIQRIA